MKELIKNNAAKALIDSYKSACNLLQVVLIDLSQEEFVIIKDSLTKDKNCRSIQSILIHVINAGNYYNHAIRNAQKIEKSIPLFNCQSPLEAHMALTTLVAETQRIFVDYPNIKLEEKDLTKKIKVTWGQLYDVEQLLEHAIVHILRHTRQIESFLKLD